jgi:hypothetical protein
LPGSWQTDSTKKNITDICGFANVRSLGAMVSRLSVFLLKLRQLPAIRCTRRLSDP